MAKKIFMKSLKKIKEAIGLSVYSNEDSGSPTRLEVSTNRTGELPNALQLIRENEIPPEAQKQTSLTLEKEITATISNNPDPHGIAFRAWEIWKEQGCPMGHDLDHWLAAEAEQMRN